VGADGAGAEYDQRALMVKSVKVQMVEETSHFSQVTQGMSYMDAIQMLKKS
jgi:hypothetical protein